MIYWRFHWLFPVVTLMMAAHQARDLTDVLANGTRSPWIAAAMAVTYAAAMWTALSMWCSVPVKLYSRENAA